jgi:hypothetical protein
MGTSHATFDSGSGGGGATRQQLKEVDAQLIAAYNKRRKCAQDQGIARPQPSCPKAQEANGTITRLVWGPLRPPTDDHYTRLVTLRTRVLANEVPIASWQDLHVIQMGGFLQYACATDPMAMMMGPVATALRLQNILDQAAHHHHHQHQQQQGATSLRLEAETKCIRLTVSPSASTTLGPLVVRSLDADTLYHFSMPRPEAIVTSQEWWFRGALQHNPPAQEAPSLEQTRLFAPPTAPMTAAGAAAAGTPSSATSSPVDSWKPVLSSSTGAGVVHTWFHPPASDEATLVITHIQRVVDNLGVQRVFVRTYDQEEPCLDPSQGWHFNRVELFVSWVSSQPGLVESSSLFRTHGTSGVTSTPLESYGKSVCPYRITTCVDLERAQDFASVPSAKRMGLQIRTPDQQQEYLSLSHRRIQGTPMTYREYCTLFSLSALIKPFPLVHSSDLAAAVKDYQQKATLASSQGIVAALYGYDGYSQPGHPDWERVRVLNASAQQLAFPAPTSSQSDFADFEWQRASLPAAPASVTATASC